LEYSNGNLKIGKDTLIFNMSSATDCTSKKLGMCSIKHKCYAMKSERMYKNVLPYRRRQQETWKKQTPTEMALELEKLISRKRKKIEYVRFSEAGDFESQKDVEKLKLFAGLLKNVIFYGYTARQDLEFKNLPDNLIINGSGFMVDNKIVLVENKYLYSHSNPCEMDCRNCSLCKEKKGIEIAIPIH